jgi:hypothetical protein
MTVLPVLKLVGFVERAGRNVPRESAMAMRRVRLSARLILHHIAGLVPAEPPWLVGWTKAAEERGVAARFS